MAAVDGRRRICDEAAGPVPVAHMAVAPAAALVLVLVTRTLALKSLAVLKLQEAPI
jgi:hypothetical protein